MAMKLPVWVSEYRSRPVWVGFSGGADSMALLLTLQEADFAVTAVHFEHGLRGAAGREDAEFCRGFCADRRIPRLQIDLALAPGPNIEAIAREHRLGHWRRLAAARPGSVVALGHQAQDAAETLLMRLARGANASGLAALRPVRVIDGVEIIRPLLEWSRSDIEAFLAERNIDHWCCDATNTDCRYLRNYLRNKLLPEWEKAFPPVAGGVREAVRNLRADADYLEQSARTLYAGRPAGAGLDCRWYGGLPEAMQIRVLRLWLAEAGDAARIPDRALAERLAHQADGVVPIDAARELEYMRGAWHLRPAHRPETEWSWRQCPEIDYAGFWRLTAACGVIFPGAAGVDEAYFDADRLPETLILTGPRDGDRLRPFGRSHVQPLKKFGHPALVVRDGRGEIIWAPGLRHTGYAPVTPETGTVVRLSWRPHPQRTVG